MLATLRAAVLGLAALAAVPAMAQDAFLVTIQHVYGETVIPAQPKRVVVWGTNSQDAVLQLYSVSPPTGLSLQWGLSRYLDLLAKAAEKAGG